VQPAPARPTQENAPLAVAAASVPIRPLYLPLPIAAAIAYRAFPDPCRPPPGNAEELEKRMNEFARAVSIAIRVYRLDLADPVQIHPATLPGGIFAGGGRVLQFRDGRPPIEPLGVNRLDFDAALASARKSSPITVRKSSPRATSAARSSSAGVS
jgi:hypothetical protein